MTLDLSRAGVVDKGTQQVVKTAMQILADVQESVAMMGLPTMPRPESQPPPLADIAVDELSNGDLAAIYTNYVAFAQYLSPKIAEAEVAYKISTANMKQVAANIQTSLLAKGVPKTEHKAIVQNHPLFVEQELEHLKLYATKTVLEAYYKSYSRQAQALSRVIEIRKLEFEQTHRDAGIGNYRPGQKRGAPGNFSRPR